MEGPSAPQIIGPAKQQLKSKAKAAQNDKLDLKDALNPKNHLRASFGDWGGFLKSKEDREERKAKQLGLQKSAKALEQWQDTAYGPQKTMKGIEADRQSKIYGRN